jgi:hypothetical protein
MVCGQHSEGPRGSAHHANHHRTQAPLGLAQLASGLLVGALGFRSMLREQYQRVGVILCLFLGDLEEAQLASALSLGGMALFPVARSA